MSEEENIEKYEKKLFEKVFNNEIKEVTSQDLLDKYEFSHLDLLYIFIYSTSFEKIKVEFTNERVVTKKIMFPNIILKRSENDV